MDKGSNLGASRTTIFKQERRPTLYNLSHAWDSALKRQLTTTVGIKVACWSPEVPGASSTLQLLQEVWSQVLHLFPKRKVSNASIMWLTRVLVLGAKTLYF